MLLAGCSSKSATVLNWDYGAISVNGLTLDISEYDGYNASYKTDDYSVEYYTCAGPQDCGHKLAEVGYDLMTKTDGMYYFTAFFGTMIEAYCQFGDGLWNEAVVGFNGSYSMPEATAISMVKPVLVNLPLNGSLQEICINNAVKLHATMSSYIVRPDCVVMPGYLKIATDDGSILFDQTALIGDKTVAYTTSSKYMYYKYKDTVIQVAQGLDINQYVELIGEE